MRQRAQQGWILLEAMLAMACVALVISATQQQMNQLTQQMGELQAKHQKIVQNALYEQMSRVFAQVPARDATTATPPVCLQCRGPQLQTVLQYELSQW